MATYRFPLRSDPLPSSSTISTPHPRSESSPAPLSGSSCSWAARNASDNPTDGPRVGVQAFDRLLLGVGARRGFGGSQLHGFRRHWMRESARRRRCTRHRKTGHVSDLTRRRSDRSPGIAFRERRGGHQRHSRTDTGPPLPEAQPRDCRSARCRISIDHQARRAITHMTPPI